MYDYDYGVGHDYRHGNYKDGDIGDDEDELFVIKVGVVALAVRF